MTSTGPDPGAARLRRLVQEVNAQRARTGDDPLWPNQVYSDAVWASSLTSTQKITALCYSNHANAKTSPQRDRAWVARDRLMQQTGIRSRDTIAKVNADLTRAGWLQPCGHRPGHKQVLVYLLTLPADTDPETVTGPEMRTSPETVTGTEDVTGPDIPSDQSQNLSEPVTVSVPTGHRTGTRLSTDPPKHSPKDPRTGHAGAVVAAYVDGAKSAERPKPTSGLTSRVGGTARRLIREGVDIERLISAAHAMGAAGWQDLEVQLQRMPTAHTSAATRNGHQPYRDPRPSDYHDGGI